MLPFWDLAKLKTTDCGPIITRSSSTLPSNAFSPDLRTCLDIKNGLRTSPMGSALDSTNNRSGLKLRITTSSTRRSHWGVVDAGPVRIFVR